LTTITGVKKIAVLRANVLGDFIFALPALQALRVTWPHAEIVYLGRAWHSEFLNGRKGPWDRVIAVPVFKGIPQEHDTIQDEQQVHNFFNAMQQQEFDVALQMHGGGRYSNPFILKLGARYTAGFKTHDAVPLDINIPYCVYHNEVLRYLELTTAIGCSIPSVVPSITVTDKDHAELQKKVTVQQPFIVLHPGGSSIRRRWPAENFAKAANAVAAKGYHIYITGTTDEEEMALTMLKTMHVPASNLCGQLSLPALTSLLSQASLVISNDTGPLHLARALNTPTVGLFQGVNMIMAAPMQVYRHRTCIAWLGHCPLCGLSFREDNFNNPQGKCKHATSFLEEIPVDEVVENALELLNVHDDRVQSHFHNYH
jgi:ADP-heptose:LPS heptosyltransferase